MLHYLKRHPF